MRPVRFKPKQNIVRAVDGRDLIVFRKTHEYDGELSVENMQVIVIAENIKYKKLFKLKRTEVDML